MNHTDPLNHRQPAFAGQFYPSDVFELKQELKHYFNKTPQPEENTEVMAVISPHAGYVFSGEVAAAAFGQLDRGKKYKTIFIIGSSHRHSFPGASIYSIGNYITPLGMVETDAEIAAKLVRENRIVAYDPLYQQNEHSIEVQIPFLQFWLVENFKIVAILLGTQDERVCRKIANILLPFFTPDNLFVISTDFSHYPAYNEAIITDKQIADAIVTNNSERVLTVVASFRDRKVPNLVTRCCSWPSVITLMYITEKREDITYKQLLYRNSGDSVYGEKDRVVGYFALSVVQKKQNALNFSVSDEKVLLAIARDAINAYLSGKQSPEFEAKLLPSALYTKAGAFVTLKKQDALRGCIGHFEADNALYKIVQQMAIAAATQDYRFPAVVLNEMDSIEIEISILTPLQKIDHINQIRLGTDGIYIKKGSRSGTFLPQVATDTNWSLEQFIGFCARDKAGIGWDGWKEKDVEIFVYQAIVFGDKE